MRWNGIEIKVLPKNDNSSAVLKHIPCRAVHGFNSMGFGRMILSSGRRGGRGRNGLCYSSEELEHVLE